MIEPTDEMLIVAAREVGIFGHVLSENQQRKVLAAMLPIAERELRAQIAAQFERAAAGRREYAANAPDGAREVLEQQAADLDCAARLARGDLTVMTAWLPSWRWTDEMMPQ